jgi:hypothetical protein
VDILRDKADLEFKRDSEAKVFAIKKGELVIERFYPMNLLQKLSLQKEGSRTGRSWSRSSDRLELRRRGVATLRGGHSRQERSGEGRVQGAR